MRPVPILPAFVTPAAAGRVAQAHVWCQHCETVHSHGAFPGHRAAHCYRKESPYRATGYELDIRGEVASPDDVVPKALYAGRHRLRSKLEDAAPLLRSALLAPTLGARGKHHLEKRLGRVRISVVGLSWWIDLDAFPDAGAKPRLRDRPDHAGRDFVSLLSTLYGVARGVVGVWLLEVAAGVSFNAAGRDGIAAAIEAAYASEAEGRDGRP
ncbi:hypothetical protein [Methylobacterium segetis]|uniref:hypothetical protein n=1 Tax=Methylobacterium segetis TaxID=2488750 RepID=UPI00104E2482|nr:hypothetical protein [Methylobacterium segetis]